MQRPRFATCQLELNQQMHTPETCALGDKMGQDMGRDRTWTFPRRLGHVEVSKFSDGAISGVTPQCRMPLRLLCLRRWRQGKKKVQELEIINLPSSRKMTSELRLLLAVFLQPWAQKNIC